MTWIVFQMISRNYLTESSLRAKRNGLTLPAIFACTFMTYLIIAQMDVGEKLPMGQKELANDAFQKKL